MGWERIVQENNILIEQREKLGLSQEEVAAKAGIKIEQYQRYESHDGRDFSSSSMRIVNAVLTALELDPTAFANGEYSFKPYPEDYPPNQYIDELLSEYYNKNEG